MMRMMTRLPKLSRSLMEANMAMARESPSSPPSSSSSSIQQQFNDNDNNNSNSHNSHSNCYNTSTTIGTYVSVWSHCLTTRYQRDQLYRFGTFDDCGRHWHDIWKVMYAKYILFHQNPRSATAMIESTYHYQNHMSNISSPTMGIIWEPKHPPGWT
jgi:hypothetical protein